MWVSSWWAQGLHRPAHIFQINYSGQIILQLSLEVTINEPKLPVKCSCSHMPNLHAQIFCNYYVAVRYIFMAILDYNIHRLHSKSMATSDFRLFYGIALVITLL